MDQIIDQIVFNLGGGEGGTCWTPNAKNHLIVLAINIVTMSGQMSLPWGSFLEAPGKLTGPVSYFEIGVSRKVGCVLTSNEVHFVSLAENFTV